METVIRRAEPQDIPALASLYVEFHNFHAEGVPTRLAPVPHADQKLCSAIAAILNDEKAAVFIACAGAELAGFAEIHLRETQPDPAVVQRHYAHLQSLCVTALLRRRGLGERLLAAAGEWARARGATEVELDIWEFPAGPLGFYTSVGFKTLRRTLVSAL